MVKARVKPTTPTPVDEAAVEAVISRGGAPASGASEIAPPQEEPKFTWRCQRVLRDQIEAALKKRPGKVSLNTWLTEAAMEKLQREG